jgi:hypothetical protein
VHQAVAGAGFVDTFAAANANAPGPTGDQDVRAATSTVTDRIDYVFARPGACDLHVVSSDTFPDAPSPYQGGVLWPSDHHAVVSGVRCGPPADTHVAASAGSRVQGEKRQQAADAAPTLAATGGVVVAPLVGLLAVGLALVLRRGRHESPARLKLPLTSPAMTEPGPGPGWFV